MSWTITLALTDCGSPSTKLSGASVLDGTTSITSLTDANGRVSYTKDDTLSSFIVKVTFHAYIGANKSLSKTQGGTVQDFCLAHLPEGSDPDDPDAATGHGGDTGGCFIVSATTGSSESAEVSRLRQLRDRVATASRLGGQLIDVIYQEYLQFSPPIAVELERDPMIQKAVLWAIVRPLLAWYSLAGVLALERTDRGALDEAIGDVLSACPRYLGGSSIVTLLETIRAGRPVPPDTHPMLLDFAPRIQEAAGLRYASWAILDALVRVWRSATDRLDVTEQIAEWLATAPLETLTPPTAPQLLDIELTVLAGFFDFKPKARWQLGERLMAAWPDAASALTSAGFVSQTIIQNGVRER